MNVGDMKNEAPGIAPGDEWAMPWDLREWAEPAQLQRWVCEEIDTLDWNNPELVEHLRQRPGYDPKSFLRLLTYAYCTGSFESEELQRRCQDREYQQLLGRRWSPAAREITRFRRENRGLLKWALVQVFKHALRARGGDFHLFLPAGVKRHLIRVAVTRLDLARQIDRGHEGL